MKKEFLILAAIVVLTLTLRLFGLADNPPSLNWDEVSHGYNAYSILKTGSDEWGKFLPIANFRAYGDYPLPLYMYLSMPGIALFGLNEFTARLPSAVFGSLMVLVVYLLAKQVFRNSQTALLSAFLLAVSPWDMMISRQVLQATPAIFFLGLGVWLFAKGASGQKWWVLLGTLSLGVSAYTYHNARILAPLIFLLLLFLYRRVLWAKKKELLLGCALAGIFFLPLIPIVTSQQGSARAVWVSILDQGAINSINEGRANSRMPDPLPKLVHNKVVYFAIEASKNYLSYFSPKFLGFEGGTQYQYSIPHFGVMYPVEVPFFYLGLLSLLVGFSRLSNEKRCLLGWLLLAPIPAAITRDPYQVIRATTMLPAVYLVTVFGFGILVSFLERKEALRKFAIAAFSILVLGFAARYLYNFWVAYPKEYSYAWQYGYKQVAKYVETYGDQYSNIVVTKKYGEPHEFMLFYLKYDPISYRDDPNLVRYERSNWFWVDSFGKLQFINDWEIIEKTSNKGNILLITSPGNYPTNGRLIETVNFLDGKPAFDIVRI